MIIQPAIDGSKGVDTTLRFNPGRAALIKSAGYDFVMRYIEALTVAERDAILGAGLGLGAVGYSRRPGWMPSAELGQQDAQHNLEHATSAGLMRGMTLFLDLEGPSASATAGACIGFVNTWARAVQAAGYIAGLYVGYGLVLTADQLYRSLAVTQYWSDGGNRKVAVRGCSMHQHAPSVYVSGLLVDTNQVTTDALGDTPVLMWAA
jgi:hypothetical protein